MPSPRSVKVKTKRVSKYYFSPEGCGILPWTSSLKKSFFGLVLFIIATVILVISFLKLIKSSSHFPQILPLVMLRY